VRIVGKVLVVAGRASPRRRARLEGTSTTPTHLKRKVAAVARESKALLVVGAVGRHRVKVAAGQSA